MSLTLAVLPGVTLVLVGEPILTPSNNPALRGVNLEVFGEPTHISTISNSVTHLRSYTNSAIADIAENSAPISPVSPYDRRRAERRPLRIERRYRRIE